MPKLWIQACPGERKVPRGRQRAHRVRGGHFASKCYRKMKSSEGKRGVKQKTYYVSEAETADPDEIVNALTERVNRLSTSKADKALVDTGSTCNVLPFDLYARITGDRHGRKLKPGHTLVQHNLQEVKARGKVLLTIERDGRKVALLFQIVGVPVQPLLSLMSSELLGLVRITASDLVRQVIDTDRQMEEDAILQDETVKPVVHAPRKVTVATRDTVEKELTRTVGEGVLAKVTQPTPWVSSLMIVPKPNGTLRICIDPRDLNKAIQREYYASITIEKVATRLWIFSVLDAKSGFNQIALDHESSLLTTFNTPFGRYRWKRMPFGINSAPEVWQRTVNEIIGIIEIVGSGDDRRRFHRRRVWGNRCRSHEIAR